MKPTHLPLTDQGLQDLNPVIAGEHRCPASHRFGPYIRQYTLLHYVLSGQGVFYARGREYPVRAGQMFVILPGEVTTYEADGHDPWHYRFVGFTGSLSERFGELPPVVDVPAQLFTDMFPKEPGPMPEYTVCAGLMKLYAFLFPGKTSANRHVRRVQTYIRSAYMQEVRVEALAREMGLDRRYLTRLFKEKTGFSVQQYLVHVRMQEADRCLDRGCTVQETAAMCGFSDVSNFSRMYKTHFGHSPGSRRKIPKA